MPAAASSGPSSRFPPHADHLAVSIPKLGACFRRHAVVVTEIFGDPELDARQVDLAVVLIRLRLSSAAASGSSGRASVEGGIEDSYPSRARSSR
jgi:hypothetical protein